MMPYHIVANDFDVDFKSAQKRERAEHLSDRTL